MLEASIFAAATSGGLLPVNLDDCCLVALRPADAFKGLSAFAVGLIPEVNFEVAPALLNSQTLHHLVALLEAEAEGSIQVSCLAMRFRTEGSSIRIGIARLGPKAGPETF